MHPFDTATEEPRPWRPDSAGIPPLVEQQLELSGYGRLRNVLLCEMQTSGRLYQRTYDAAGARETLVYADDSSTLFGGDACSDCAYHDTRTESWAARVFAALKPVISDSERRGMTAIVLSAPCFRNEFIASAFRREGRRATGYSVHVVSPPASRTSASGEQTLQVTTTLPVCYTVTNTEAPVFDVANRCLARLLGTRKVLLVVDRRVMKIYGEQIRAYFSACQNLAGIVALAGNESAKTWANIELICRHAVESGLDRSSVIVAVGGGIVMDLAGVAASLYRRGIEYIRVPTTLIGIVDVAVGVKHGFNFMHKKNALGTFYPPAAAVVDRRFLQTLDTRQLRCGLSEVLKMAIVRDARLFGLVEASSGPLLATAFSEPNDVAEEIILRAQASMADELMQNLFERDKKRLVDFGHTVSPLLESATNYTMHHGEAVAVDMMISASIALVKGVCDASDFQRIKRVYAGCGLPSYSEHLTIELLAAALEYARGHRGGALNLVVPERIGSATFVQDVTAAEMESALSLLR